MRITGTDEPLGSRRQTEWRLELWTHSFGWVDGAEPVVLQTTEYDENRVLLRYDSITEWLVNAEEGLEHGWSIDSPPTARDSDGLGLLQIEVGLGGNVSARIGADGSSLTFVDACGNVSADYGKLLAHDATGRPLDACMDLSAGKILLTIDAGSAVYPITVDPLLCNPSWSATQPGGMERFSFSVANAGDVNGDGFGDVIVGAYLFNHGASGTGRAFVYHGPGPSGAPNWTADGNSAGTALGYDVASAGDVNGDGYDDVIVGAFDDHAYVFMGGPQGLSATAAVVLVGDPGTKFGRTVSGAGDVNGDGFDDVIVGARQHGPTDAGAAFLFEGSASGLSSVASWRAVGGQDNVWFGWSVASAGDVNDDGYDDLIIGAPFYDNGESNEGRAFVYLGSAQGPALSPVWSAEGDSPTANLGKAVGTAGDVNGDGYDDVIVGAPAYDAPPVASNVGCARLYLGSPAGPQTLPAWEVCGSEFGELGGDVGPAGDVEGDGYDDFIIGALYSDGGRGRVYVYSGAASVEDICPPWTVVGDNAFSRLGTSVSTAGDVNGDGRSDVIIGSGAEGELFDLGEAFLYMGTTTTSQCGGLCPCGATQYCQTAPNSVGNGAIIDYQNSLSIAANDLVLSASDCPPGQFGVFFYGALPANVPFGDGFWCVDVGGGAERFNPPIPTTDQGLAELALDFTQPPLSTGPHAVFPGSVWRFQFWYRDPQGGAAGFNLSNGLRVRFCP